MAAIDFPASPAVNQLFTAPNGVTYMWTGVLWVVYSPALLGGPIAPQLRVEDNTNSIINGTYAIAGVPQISGGARITQQSYTANNAANKIRLRYSGMFLNTTAQYITLALFIDGAVNAARSVIVTPNTNWNAWGELTWEGVLAAGAHTFELRGGGVSGGFYLNTGTVNGGGGTEACVLVIEEVGQGVQGPPGVAGPPGVGSYLIQSKYGEYTAFGVAHGTAMSMGTTPPAITEGEQLIAVPITPTNAGSRIRLRAQGIWTGNSASISLGAGLFDSRSSPALVTCACGNFSNGSTIPMHMEIEVPAGSTAARTYSLRVGPNTGAGSVFMNGYTTAYGNARTTLIVDEISP